MQRDKKGRFTKALAKVKVQPPTDVRLARKMARIDEVRHDLHLARAVWAINALFLVASFAMVAASPIVGSIPMGALGVVSVYWRFGEYRDARHQYWNIRATHERLLKGADQLTNKLLAEENIIDSDS